MRELLPADENRRLLGDERAGVRCATLLALLESQLVTPAEASRLVNDPTLVSPPWRPILSKVERDLANLLQVSPSGEFVGSQTISIREHQRCRVLHTRRQRTQRPFAGLS